MVSGAVRRRVALAAASGVVIVAGLVAHGVGTSVAAAISDGLYTVLVYLVLGFVLVRARPWMLGVAAFALSAAVEAAQLTGLPERWSEAVPVVGLVLGSTFSAWDLVAYAGGAIVAVVADATVARGIEGIHRRRSARPTA